MTTIATDGKTISADTRMGGDYIDQIVGKKLYKHDGIVYGYSGQFKFYTMHFEWVKSGRPKDSKPEIDDNFSLIFVKNGKCYFEDKSFSPVEVGIPQACGSGSVMAMAAMLAGVSPSKAVKIAIELDQNSGGKVRTMKC